MDWSQFFIVALEIARGFGVPIALIVVVLALRPVFMRVIDRATSISIRHIDAGVELVDGNAPPITSVPPYGTTVHLADRSKEEIEKLRLFLETEQAKQLIVYHQNGLYQSRVAFWFSIGAASIGFLVIILGVGTIFASSQTTTSFVSIGSGVLIDAVAALFFTQSNQASD